MDPDAALKVIREAVDRLLDGGMSAETAETVGTELAERFNDLDTWFTSGGFLPEAWHHPLSGPSSGPMSPEAEQQHLRIIDGINDLFSQFGEMFQGDAREFATWAERGRMVRQMLIRYLALQGEAREFRRAYGHEVDAALLNRFEMNLENTGALLPAMFDVVLDGMEETA